MKLLFLLVFGCVAAISAPAANTPVSPAFEMRLVVDAPSSHSKRMPLITKRADSVYTNMLNVERTILLDQTAIKSVNGSTDALGHPIIDITLTDAGKKEFAGITRDNIGKQLAIVIDGKLYEAPLIRSEIPDGKAQISGNFTTAEAKALVEKIRSAQTR
jgi:preprotein translocase subunit SecD